MKEKVEMIKSKLNILTPIIQIDNVYYKRDDLFQPFKDGELTKTIEDINGTKLRQALSLLINNLDLIKDKCNNTIVDHQSSSTQQGVLITSCANIFNIETILVIGKIADKTIENNVVLNNIQKLGASFDRKCKASYNSVLDARVNELVCENNYFDFNFVANSLNNFDSIIEPIMYQCKNIPDDIEQIIVPAGNSIIFSAVACGIDYYNKKAKVIGIQISGLDKSEISFNIINKYLLKYNKCELNCDIELIIDKSYSYSSNVEVIVDNIKLDPVYEAKAYNYMINNIDLTKKTLFWIAGNSEPSRKQIGW